MPDAVERTIAATMFGCKYPKINNPRHSDAWLRNHPHWDCGGYDAADWDCGGYDAADWAPKLMKLELNHPENTTV